MVDPARIKAALAHHPPRVIDRGVLRPAAVLVFIYPKGGEDTVLFTRRSDQLPDHAGEISFPGGRREPEDLSLEEAALRESEEEMGIRPRDVRILGRLDDFVSVYGYHVTPFVGSLPWPYSFRVNDSEIAEVIEVPLARLCDPAVFHTENWEHKGRLHPVGFFTIDHHQIWGLTAAILRQFLRRIGAMEF